VNLDPILAQRLEAVRLLVLDVDGVLTRGDITYGPDGAETKVFNVKDGLGLRLLMDHGVTVAVITGRRSSAVDYRCRDLGIQRIHQGIKDKLPVFNGLLAQNGVTAEQTAVVGDDLPELALMRAAGLAVAVADAHPLVCQAAHLVTAAAGGCGAVRQVCEMILQAQGAWDRITARFAAGVRV